MSARACLKRALTQPYWVRRRRSEQFNAAHRLHTPQPPRKRWEVYVPWHTRGDMRKPLAKPVTFWGSLVEAVERVGKRLRS